jgi:hypothetical protein
LESGAFPERVIVGGVAQPLDAGGARIVFAARVLVAADERPGHSPAARTAMAPKAKPANTMRTHKTTAIAKAEQRSTFNRRKTLIIISFLCLKRKPSKLEIGKLPSLLSVSGSARNTIKIACALGGLN